MRNMEKDLSTCWTASSHLFYWTLATTASSPLAMQSESLRSTSDGGLMVIYSKPSKSFVDQHIFLNNAEKLSALKFVMLSIGSVWISSEMKGLNDDCEHFEVFPPGHLYSSKEGGYKRWYNPPWYSEAIPSVPYDPLVLRKAFENVRLTAILVISKVIFDTSIST